MVFNAHLLNVPCYVVSDGMKHITKVTIILHFIDYNHTHVNIFISVPIIIITDKFNVLTVC